MGRNTHGKTFVGLGQDGLEGHVIGGLLEERQTGHGSVQYMRPFTRRVSPLLIPSACDLCNLG